MIGLRTILVGLAIFLCSMTAAAQSDLRVLKGGPDTVVPGNNVTYTITVANDGPDAAAAVDFSDNIPNGLTFVSLTPSTPGIFTCSTPSVGSGGAISCSAVNFANGGSVQFTLVLNVPAETAEGVTFNNIATVAVTEGTDNNGGNNSSSWVFLTVSSDQSDLSVTKTGPGTAAVDSDVTFTIQVTNGGPSTADTVTLTDNIPSGLTFVSMTATMNPGIFDCTPLPAPGSGGTITCTASSFPSSTTVQLRPMK